MRDLIVPANLGVDLSQYFGLWAVEEGRFLAAFERAAAMDLEAHVKAARGGDYGGSVEYEVRDGIAVIDVSGTLTKRGSSMSDAGSMVRLRQKSRAAGRDNEVTGVMFRFDTPGGTVAGTSDLAEEIAAVAAVKPTAAFVEDLCASAGYWLASQAGEISANSRTAMVGSIGTFVGLYDLSGAAAQQGIRPVVIKSGAHKAAGFPGTEITQEQRDIWQALVDKTQAEFSAAVAKGRKLPRYRVDGMADGRVHMAADAMELGLVDRIESFDEAMARLAAKGRRTTAKGQMRSEEMSEETKVAAPAPSPQQTTTTNHAATLVAAEPIRLGPRSATAAELRAACPGADAGFLFSQAEAGATVEAAKDAWIKELGARHAAAQQEAEDAKAAAKRPGVDPVRPNKAGANADSADFGGMTWEAAVAAEVKNGARNRMDACSRANVKYPGLRQQAVVDHNARHRPKVKVDLD